MLVSVALKLCIDLFVSVSGWNVGMTRTTSTSFEKSLKQSTLLSKVDDEKNTEIKILWNTSVPSLPLHWLVPFYKHHQGSYSLFKTVNLGILHKFDLVWYYWVKRFIALIIRILHVCLASLNAFCNIYPYIVTN